MSMLRYLVDINVDELDSGEEVLLLNEIDDFVSNHELVCDKATSVRVRVQDEYCIKEEAKRLKSVEKAVIPPVDVGDIVWYIRGGYYKSQDQTPQPIEVTEINKKWHGKTLEWGFIANSTRYRFSSIGKSVFLSEQDAIEFLERKAVNYMRIHFDKKVFEKARIIMENRKNGVQPAIFIVENGRVYMATITPDHQFCLTDEGLVGERYDETGKWCGDKS